MGLMSEALTQILIPVAALIGIGFALLLWFLVSKVRVSSGSGLENEYNDMLIKEDNQEEGIDSDVVVAKCTEIQKAISEVKGFRTESARCTFDKENLCKPALANAFFTAIVFLLCVCVGGGGLTSSLSGFLGMKIATYANARMTLEARKSNGKAFITAFRSGAVMGFLFAANGLLVRYISINIFKLYYGDDWEGLSESITDYGLGGSLMALFGRVGGGIYTKEADVGADLVGKVERNTPEDDPRNLAVDNVGDIAEMGLDLFGSYADSWAALFVASMSSFDSSHDYSAMSYPLIISSMGIVVCLITTLFATDMFEIKKVTEIEPSLKRQLLISSVLVTIGIAFVSFFTLPSEFTIFDFGSKKVVKNWHLFFCVSIGLWAGLVIGYTNEYYTSNAYSRVQDVADPCRTGAVTNVIFGLALGYKSIIIPIFSVAASIYFSFSLAAMYGIAVAALGMHSTIATGLAIDAYCPISDNAGGIAEMAGMSCSIRERTDALDAAGNTTAAIGKGFAIGSAALVSLPFFGAYVSRAGIKTVDVLHRRDDPARRFGHVNTSYCWFLFLVETLAGVLAGSLISGVQGEAWDNAKKYIEAGATEHARALGQKGSDAHKAAVIGDTVGDPLKDTSGPSLKIIIKLMAVESLVFAPFFATHGRLLFKLL
ncbi:unnamed protein product [Withania somnifera]